MSNHTLSSSAPPKASSFAMAQEVYDEGGIEAVLEMLSSRTTVLQVSITLLRPPPLPSNSFAAEASRAPALETVRKR